MWLQVHVLYSGRSAFLTSVCGGCGVCDGCGINACGLEHQLKMAALREGWPNHDNSIGIYHNQHYYLTANHNQYSGTPLKGHICYKGRMYQSPKCYSYFQEDTSL